MANSIADFNIPRITDLAAYYAEIYDVPFLAGAPTFYQFLTEIRGIPVDYFSSASWEAISLQNEMVAYNMIIRSLAERAQHEAQAQRASAAKNDSLTELSLRDLMMTRNVLQKDLDELDAHIATAAQTQADSAGVGRT